VQVTLPHTPVSEGGTQVGRGRVRLVRQQMRGQEGVKGEQAGMRSDRYRR